MKSPSSSWLSKSIIYLLLRRCRGVSWCLPREFYTCQCRGRFSLVTLPVGGEVDLETACTCIIITSSLLIHEEGLATPLCVWWDCTVIIIMLLLNHELEGDFIWHSYTTTMMIVIFISIFLHNYYDDLICNSDVTALSSSSNGSIDKSGNKGYQHARTLTTLTKLCN